MGCFKLVVIIALLLVLETRDIMSSGKHTVSSEERRHNLQHACGHVGTSPLSAIALHHILVNEAQNILYCYVPKVACSNWKRVITVLDGNAKDTDSIKAVNHTGFLRLSMFKPNEVLYRLKNYYKFMFVREPLDRLVSAYKDKLTGNNDYYNDVHVKKMVQRFRHDDDEASDAKGATLMEFFRYLETSSPAAMDEHWMPYYQLCQPCTIDYDFIGSIENVNEDAQEVLRQANLENLVRFPRKQRMYTERRKNPSTKELLAQIPKWLIRRIVDKYSKDYELFSYEKPKIDLD